MPAIQFTTKIFPPESCLAWSRVAMVSLTYPSRRSNETEDACWARNNAMALYLSAIALLRAQHASSVSLLRRLGYVKETIATLDQAKQLSGGKIFVVNWIAGIVHAELPAFFRQRKAAEAELAWCAENADKAPHAGWLREVYYHQGKQALAD